MTTTADAAPPHPPGHAIAAVATIMAEARLLTTWANDTQHKRLRDAYLALAERVMPRAQHMLHSLGTSPDVASLFRATLADAERHASTIEHELGRLSWLLQNRRTRTTSEGIPGYRKHLDAEHSEAHSLESLVRDIAAHVC